MVYLGNDNGYSIREVIDSVRRVNGHDFRVKIGPKRTGVPAVLVADSRLAKEQLGWPLQYAVLKKIMHRAWAWEQQKSIRW